MFKFAHRRQVWWPVKIKQPKDDGSGQTEELEAQVLFELLSKSEARTLESASPEQSDELLRSKIKGWREICDPSGEPIDCTPETLASLLDVPYIERAFSIGLLQATVGAAAKN